ncbi:MAG: hypothetical protein MJ165_04695, partial [Alphaproteobacteria bacterium]|nr:hypothetical protein [Alphaproteobacteria bacterium]
MTFIKLIGLNVSVLAILCCAGTAFGYQAAWDNPGANMTSGSTTPGYANLTWSTGTVLPIKTRAGMATLVTLPLGDTIEDYVVGDGGLFTTKLKKGDTKMWITPSGDNKGSDTNMIVTGRSGNRYIFYLRAYPVNSPEITYSQVDISAGAGVQVNNYGASGTGTMQFMDSETSSKKPVTVGVDGEDYGWIKTMKIDPSEFRFDLDIFVPNPDDYVIAPERV